MAEERGSMHIFINPDSRINSLGLKLVNIVDSIIVLSRAGMAREVSTCGLLVMEVRNRTTADATDT